MIVKLYYILLPSSLGSLLAPQNVAVYMQDAHRIVVEWDPVSDGTITGYKVRYVDLKNYKLANITTGASHVLIDSLLPYTSYGICVASFNDQGEGASSPEVVATTDESGNIYIAKLYDDKLNFSFLKKTLCGFSSRVILFNAVCGI